MRKLCSVLAALIALAALLFQGCAASGDALDEYDKPEVRIGVQVGALAMIAVEQRFTRAEIHYLSTDADCIMALERGYIDAYAHDVVTLRYICTQRPGLKIIYEPMGHTDIAIGINKRRSDLVAPINACLEKFRQEGVLDDMFERWTGGLNHEMPSIPAPENPDKTLRVGTAGLVVPMTYYADGKLTGFDIELTARLARELNWNIELSAMNFDALVAGLQSDKLDIVVSNLNVTPERANMIHYSEPYLKAEIMLLVRDAEAQGASGNFFENIIESFKSTFIVDNRWKMVLSGLRTTLTISVMSGCLGTLLGFGVCMARKSRYKPLSRAAAVYIRILQGMPIVVILMILYFLVFSSGANSEFVAIVGFSINFAAYVSEMMRASLDTVDKGQIEAAGAMGFTRAQAFAYITLPQAARHFMPVFRGEFISLVKMTSVVGYITIMDITKVSDIIRSHTYEAFFPLLATALIYFALSWLLTLALTALEKRINPGRKTRALKGVSVK